MRKLMYFTIGFALSCGLLVYLESKWIGILCGAAAVVLVSVLGRKTQIIRRFFVTVLGCAAGLMWYSQFHSLYLEPIIPLDGGIIPLTIRASDFGEVSQYGTRFDGTLQWEGKTYQITTWLNGSVDVEPGMQFAGTFYLKKNIGEDVSDLYDPGNGIFLKAYQEDTVTIAYTSAKWWDHPAKLRRQIGTILKNYFPEDSYPFVKALFLGDTSDLSYEVDMDLKVSGIRHVVAVSGLHISILFTLISVVTLRRRFWMALVGYPVLFLFAAVTGFTPSVVRACLMSGLMLLGMLVNGEYDGPTSLSFAVLVMLILNPLVISSVSFQLSVTSVAGIFLFEPGIRNWLQSFFGEIKGKSLRARLIRWFTGSVSVTLGAISLTTPLCAYYFGMVSLVGVLANLLTLWVISMIFYGIMAVCLLHLIVPGGAALIASAVSVLVRYVLWTAGTLTDFPIAAVYTSSPYITAWLVFVYGLLIFFLISSHKRPAILSCCAAIGLCLALIADWTEPMWEDVRFTVLDVGQGQCLILQSEGRTFVVDCGGDQDSEAADLAAETLLRQGIQKLDGLILTHMDRDHSGGAAGLLSRIETELLILPPVYSELPMETEAQLICASEDMEITFGNSVIRIFTPTFPGTSNENSLCVLFDTQKCDILITGDRDGYGERSLLRGADIPEVDVLVSGHHGSANSTCEELLEAVTPQIVCISVGEDNPYGHPAPELLQRLEKYGCQIYRTDIQGTITIRR